MKFPIRRSSALAEAGVIALLLIGAALPPLLRDYAMPPFEDAAMLMRYALHLGQGHGIVWNIGEPPVDGATDFLFMAAAALLVKAGGSVEFAVRSLNVAAHLLTVLLIHLVMRRVHGASLIASLFSALWLAWGPGLSYIAACFGTPFFALFACATWALALKLERAPGETWRLSLLFSLSALATGLARPDGVILVALMLSGLVVLRGWRRSRRAILCFVSVFLLLGGAYFLWRWHYFGHPLPNPYYKKGGGVFHPRGLRNSISNALHLTSPFLAVFLLAPTSRVTLRRATACAIPIAGYTAAFGLISDEMNYRGRFQYALLPLILLSWQPLAREAGVRFAEPAWRNARHPLRAAASICLCIGLGWLLIRHYLHSGTLIHREDGRRQAALALRDYAGNAYTMVATEAGLLPLYSEWRAVDAWGLNDPWIARNGEITDEYLDRFKPELIVFHAFFSPTGPLEQEDPWNRMTATLREYALDHGYILAAAFGVAPGDAHYFYVRPDFPDSTAIADRIRSLEYRWPGNGKQAVNFAEAPAEGASAAISSGKERRENR